MDHRVVFDFEIEFSNGGGVQGQDFRLDIDSDDISDEDLAAYIVTDLRLLMVEQVRILNKRIIEEPHKRPPAPGVTCLLRYEIDPRQVDAFERYVTGWIPIIHRHGGIHHGCFLPHEGSNDVAYALFSFPSLADYEGYRAKIRTEPDAAALWEITAKTHCVRRFDRTFMRPCLP